MLYCNTCGQCLHINRDHFYEIRNTSGWEKNIIGCEEEDYIDTDDSECTDSEHVDYECPYCDSNDIERDSDVTEEEALAQREEYTGEKEKLRRVREAKKIKDENWDPEDNM